MNKKQLKPKESYNLEEYLDQVVLKTLLIKEDRLFNVSHMVLGMGSEFMSELPLAILQKNHTNIIEEIGDIEFFAVGYAYFEGITLPTKFESTTYQKLIIPLLLIQTGIGQLQTIVKKELVSGVKKLDGVIVTHEKLTSIVYDILIGIQLFCEKEKISLEHTIRPANARKLNIRYDGGGFTAEHSLNRDYEAETLALENIGEKLCCGDNEECAKCSTSKNEFYGIDSVSIEKFKKTFTEYDKKTSELFSIIYHHKFNDPEIFENTDAILNVMLTTDWSKGFIEGILSKETITKILFMIDNDLLSGFVCSKLNSPDCENDNVWKIYGIEIHLSEAINKFNTTLNG